MIGTRPTGLTDFVRGVWGVDFTDTWAHSLNTDAHVFYVQPNSIEATDNGNTGESPQKPFATVAAALLRCADNRGDVILVGGNDGWQYGGGSAWRTPIIENVIVEVEGVSIIGVTADALGVPWEPATDGGTCIAVNVLGVELAGFCFQDPVFNNGTAVRLVWTGGGGTQYGENAKIHHCFFGDGMDEGINIDFAWNNHIHDCIFQSIDYGIYTDPAKSGFAYNLIERCWFYECAISAISGLAASSANLVRDCQVYNSNAQGGGAATDEGFDFTGGARNMVENCSFSCILPAGAPGDWDDLNTAGATDAWINCHLLNGNSVTNPT